MRARIVVLVAGLLLVLIGAECALAVGAVPDPVAADAAPSVFSAYRAKADIAQFADAPHPSGSAGAERTRAYVSDRLTRLGLEPVEDEATEVVPGDGASHLAGRVHDITATIRGTSPTGQVLLVAHTDSVLTGPGASDDGLGVSSLLEIARILTKGPRPRNDVVLLFTDSEETGQLGARAYVHGLGKATGEPRVVLNLEARGTSGRAVMFETGSHSSALVEALGGHPPVATSLSAEVYRRLPNDTDFTQLRKGGMTGLNFAVIGDGADYHAPGDDVAHVHPGSLQDLGDTVLSAVRRLSATDLRAVTRSSDATWFNVGPLLVRYPAGAVLPLAVAAPLALVAAGWYARRRKALRPSAVPRAALTLPLVLVGAAALGWAGWRILLLIRPYYASFLTGDPYRTAPVVVGLLLLTAALTGLWAAWTGRRAGQLETAVGIAVWPALLAVPTALLLPGAAYVFTWTALGVSAGVALGARAAEDSPWRTTALVGAALPAVIVLVPLVTLLFPTLGLAAAAAPLALAALVLAVLAAPLTRWFRGLRARRLIALAAVVALAGTVCVGGAVAADRPDADHPRPVSLMYALDADHGRAYWVSEDADPVSWVTGHTGHRRTDTLEAWSPALAAPPGGLLAGPAPVAPVATPEVTKVSDTREGATRTVRLKVGPGSGKPAMLALYVDTSTTHVVRARVAGAPAGIPDLSGGENRPHAGSPWKWGLLMVAPDPRGQEVTLVVRGDKPLRLLAMTEDAGLPAQALRSPRPAGLTWEPGAAGLSFASRRYTI
ncbi:M20/M25/M40 family metallo-hydrolase [Streptomyces sp. NPDC048106]|uniref:M20/M25/M40 family metallo-hydrolase n=1 Tax=Streptomyces sp. NPDC048106 TaxID=3155750 RepID=UPI0034531CFE